MHLLSMFDHEFRLAWLDQIEGLELDQVAASAEASGRCQTSPVGHARRSDHSLIADTMLVIWQHPTTRHMEPVARLERSSSGYRFRYLRRAAAVEGFRPLMGFPDLERDYRSPGLFSLFEGRAMSPRRPDYEPYLDALGLATGAGPWEQVARSEGHQATDRIQVFPLPIKDESGQWICRFLVHGIRHLSATDPQVEHRLARLQPGDALRLVAEPDNPYSSRAVLTCDDEAHPLGYVPHFLLDHLEALRENGPVRVNVATINGPGAPAHLRLAVHLIGTADETYVPFASEEFATMLSRHSKARPV